MDRSSPPLDVRLHANGKLLLTGEYFVLDGALALATPVRYGQSLIVRRRQPPGELRWQSYRPDGGSWFDATFELPGFSCRRSSDQGAARRLATILRAAAEQRPAFADPSIGLDVETRLDFPRRWGLGSSSTLLSLVARWLEVDPFALLKASFGGSGYDLACATADGPILYQRHDGRPQYVRFPFAPAFADQLYFVYLGRKQNSRAGIARYRERVRRRPGLIDRISHLTAAALTATDLEAFETALLEHEALVAATVDLPRAADLHFPNYWGVVKSLGAWGGDFVLLTSRRDASTTRKYVESCGFSVFFSYSDLILDKVSGRDE